MATGHVLALGTVSLFTDASSEMVTAVLPAYLVLGCTSASPSTASWTGCTPGARR